MENVLYCNPDNGYTVLELDADGTLVTVVGEMGETEEGERLSVDGEYTTHPRFGMQFRAQYWERQAAGRCLQYPAIPFLRCDQRHRTVAGEKIVENFGDRTLEIMEKEPLVFWRFGASPRKSAKRSPQKSGRSFPCGH